MGKSINAVKISSAIVLYNNNEQELKDVISSILSNKIVNKLYLIDNSPTQRLSFLKEINSEIIEYLFLDKNIGFGKAHNIAIKKSLALKFDYHTIVNPDIVFNENVFEKLLFKMEKEVDLGLIMPKIIYENGETQYICKLIPTPSDLIFRRFIPKTNSKQNYKYEFRFSGYNKEMEVPILSGCFMFIRNSVLKQVKGFDERFFMYLEDVDLSRRIHEISKTIFYPDVEVKHKYEKGSYKSKKLLGYHIKSAIKYFNKWGWFFDKKRGKFNKRILEKYNL